MTAGGAANDAGSKTNENILSIATKSDTLFIDNEAYKILLEQAIYEMHRGSYGVALEYLNRAVTVRNEK